MNEYKIFAALCWISTAGCTSTDLSPHIHSLQLNRSSDQNFVTVADILEVAEIGDPQTSGWADYNRIPGHFSPDGNYAAVVVTRGNASTKMNEGWLLIYDLRTYPNIPAPVVATYIETRSDFQPISSVNWESRTGIVFVGADDDSNTTQLFRYDKKSNRTTKLTHFPTAIREYVTTRGGGYVAFAQLPVPVLPRDQEQCISNGCRISAPRFGDALFGGSIWDRVYGGQVVHFNERGEAKHSLSMAVDATDLDCWLNSRLPIAVSDSGEYVVLSCELHAWPDWWVDYDLEPLIKQGLENGDSQSARGLFLLNLIEGTFRPLLGTPDPSKSSAKPVFVDSGTKVIVAAAFEPLDSVSGDERIFRETNYSLLVIDLESGDVKRIASLKNKFSRVLNMKWNHASSLLTVEGFDLNGDRVGYVWRRDEHEWLDPKEIVIGDESGDKISLRVQQSFNVPPILFATSTVDGTSVELLDPNPWLDEINRSRVEEIEFKVNKNRIWSGLLFYPPNYNQDRRYPIVIQTHGVNRGKFSLHGLIRQYAAHAIAARDILVLQLNDDVSDVAVSPAEWPTAKAGYESVIDALDDLHLIDRNRVGLVGWSRTGINAGYMISQSDYPIAAAAFTLSSDLGWWYYLRHRKVNELNLIYGSSPFGGGMEPWLEEVTGFNLPRINTPMMLWDASDELLFWDWYAGLERLGKPVEYWAFSDVSHDMLRASQRLVANELLVDWFDFWLNDASTDDLSKREQFVRWKKLKADQESNLNLPRPPLLDWSFSEKE